MDQAWMAAWATQDRAMAAPPMRATRAQMLRLAMLPATTQAAERATSGAGLIAQAANRARHEKLNEPALTP
jgi:hypothetical protein